MKKLIAVIAVLILLFTGFLAYMQFTSPEISPEAETDEFDYEAYFNNLEAVDYDRLSAFYKPDDVICTVGGEEITWKQYSYYYKYFTSGIESTIAYAPMYYGLELHWDDMYDDEITFAEAPAALTEEQLAVHAAINKMAEENNVKMSQTIYDDYLNANLESTGAENADEFFASLEENGLDRDLYEFVVGNTALAESVCEALYGSADNEENVDKMNDDIAKAAEDMKLEYASGFEAPYVKDFLI